MQARRSEEGEDEAGHRATNRAQRGEVQDGHAGKVGMDDMVQIHL